MENQLEKTMGNERETGIVWGFLGGYSISCMTLVHYTLGVKVLQYIKEVGF